MTISTWMCSLLLLAGMTAACAAEAPRLPSLWHEGEVFTAAAGGGVRSIGEKDPASGGHALWGLALTKKDRSVNYEIQLPHAIPQARLVFRFARQFWRPDIRAAVIPITLTVNGQNIQREVTFGDTRGWGTTALEWSLAEAQVGDLKAGKGSLTLTAPADESDISLDGFWILPPKVQLAPEELTTLQRLQIGPDGYLGLRVCSGILDQKAGTPLVLVARSFTGAAAAVQASFIKPNGESVELTAAAETKADGASGARRWNFRYPDLADGPGTLKIRCAQPALTLDVPVHFAGELLAGLDGRVAKIEAFAKELPQATQVDRRRHSDFDYALKYLQREGLDRLRHCAAPADPATLGYFATAKIRPPEILLANVIHTLAQYEQTMVLLSAHRDPDAERLGDLRRCLNAKAKNGPVPYRLYVPDTYAQADKMPLILVLHGANDDEDGMFSGENAAILRLAQRRGYILLAPTYRRNEEGYMDYLLEVLAEVRTSHPKIDPQRIYVYGFSMGGNASSQMAARHPEIFAAAFSGGGFCMMDEVERLQVPVRVLIGAEDPAIKGIAPRVARMLELGKTLDLHVEPGLPHTCPAEKFMNMGMDFFEQHSRK